MRTTVDLLPAVRQRAEEIARERGQSLSAVVAELATLGLAQLDDACAIETDAHGWPLFRIGRTITPEYVAEILDES